MALGLIATVQTEDKRACSDAQAVDLIDRGLGASDFAHTGEKVISYAFRVA